MVRPSDDIAHTGDGEPVGQPYTGYVSEPQPLKIKVTGQAIIDRITQSLGKDKRVQENLAKVLDSPLIGLPDDQKEINERLREEVETKIAFKEAMMSGLDADVTYALTLVECLQIFGMSARG